MVWHYCICSDLYDQAILTMYRLAYIHIMYYPSASEQQVPNNWFSFSFNTFWEEDNLWQISWIIVSSKCTFVQRFTSESHQPVDVLGYFLVYLSRSRQWHDPGEQSQQRSNIATPTVVHTRLAKGQPSLTSSLPFYKLFGQSAEMHCLYLQTRRSSNNGHILSPITKHSDTKQMT